MSIYVALLLFAIIILLYWGISELFTILFSFTGLPGSTAFTGEQFHPPNDRTA